MEIGFEKDGVRVSLAQSNDDIRDAQRLRYDVFVAELGAGGEEVDHSKRLEQDQFDEISDHLLLREISSGDTIAVYRLLRGDALPDGQAFYTEAEFDLAGLRHSGRRLLELGRSCVRADHRGSGAMFHLWSGLAQYVKAHASEILFGTASFKGTDPQVVAQPLSLLAQAYAAPSELAVKSRAFQNMNLVAPEMIDRRAAMIDMPPLIKAYLRLGGKVGTGAFIDHEFNCIDVCMVMDTDALNARAARLYQVSASR